MPHPFPALFSAGSSWETSFLAEAPGMSVLPHVAEAWCHHLAPSAVATVSCCVRLSQKGAEGGSAAGAPAAVSPAQTCSWTAVCQSCLSFVCMEECLWMLFL